MPIIMGGYTQETMITPKPLKQPLVEYPLQQNEKIEAELAQRLMSLFTDVVQPKAKKQKPYTLGNFNFALSNGACAIDGFYNQAYQAANPSFSRPSWGRITVRGAAAESFGQDEKSYQYNALCIQYQDNKIDAEEVFYDPAQDNAFIGGVYPGVSVYHVADAGDFVMAGHEWLRGEPEKRMTIVKELLSHLVSLQESSKTDQVEFKLD